MLTIRTPVRRIDALAYSPDGAELAAGGVSPGGTEHGIVVLTPDGRPTWGRALADCPVSTVGYTAAGGHLLAVARHVTPSSFRGGLFVLDRYDLNARPDPLDDWMAFAVAADRLLGTVRVGGVHGRDERFVCRRLSSDGVVGPLWDVAGEAGTDAVGVALLPDGRAVTIGHDREDSGRVIGLTLAVRSADTGRVLATATPPGQTHGPLTASPDGERLVLNAGGSLFVWRVADLTAPPRKVTFGRKHCTGVAFLADGHLLAAGNDGTIRRIDPDTGATAASYSFTAGKVRSLAVAPDGPTAAVGTDRGTVIVFDLD